MWGYNKSKTALTSWLVMIYTSNKRLPRFQVTNIDGLNIANTLEIVVLRLSVSKFGDGRKGRIGDMAHTLLSSKARA